MNWRQLYDIGKNKLITSSYVWIFLVPVIAKIIKNAPPEVLIKIGITEVPISLALPFSWTVFYFMALSFSIGKLSYLLCCPRLIQQAEDWSSYKAKGLGTQQLLYAYAHWVRNEGQSYDDKGEKVSLEKSLNRLIREFCTNKELFERKNVKALNIETRVQLFKVDDLSAANMYWLMRAQMLLDKPIGRLICTISYTLGMILFFWVIVENMLYVMDAVF